MGTDGTSRGSTLAETLAVFEGAGERGEPLTATEVAERLDCARERAVDRLETLADRDDLLSKRTGSQDRVWWRQPGTGASEPTGSSDGDRAQCDERDDPNRDSELVRDVNHALVTATTRAEIDRAVCERLAAAGPYCAAGVAERTADGAFRARALAGVDERVPDGIADTADPAAPANSGDATDSPAPAHPARECEVGAEALERRAVQVALRNAADPNPRDRGATDPDAGDRETAGPDAGDRRPTERDSGGDSAASTDDSAGEPTGAFDVEYEAVAMVPLVHGDEEFGVLAVYANDPAVFDERRTAVLGELGQSAGLAVAAIRREERERRLTDLRDATRRLVDAESREEAGDAVVEAVTEDLGMDDAHVYHFDAERNALEQVSTSVVFRSQAARSHTLSSGDDSPVWSAFVTGETSVRGPEAAPILPDRSLHRRTEALVPLGTHGVLVAATDDADRLDPDRRHLLDLVAATAEAALDRIDSRAALRERDAALAERNRQLQRLTRINTVIRDVDKALVRATTDAEILSVVCEELTRTDGFRFAWIGEASEDGDRLLARAWSGEGRGYLEGAGVESVRPVGEPAGRAFESGEVTVVPNVAENLRSESWRSEALTREFQSVISVPLCYGDLTYGVLSVYADGPDAFGEMEQSVFAELGRTIANGINAVETRRALVNDQMVELEFSLAGDSTSFLTHLAVETGAEVAFEGVVPKSDEAARVFFTVGGPAADEVRAALDRFVSVESTRLVSSDGDGHLFEAVVSGSPVPLTLLDQNATLLGLSAAEDEARLVVGLPSSTDVRHFIERLLDRYEGAEFVARRERDTPVQSRDGFRFELADALTDRQLEVLKTAYLSGYFSSPRASTGSELGRTLGISQPTVTEHLRAAQSKLFDLLFADDPTRT